MQWTVLAVVNSVLIGTYSALLGSDINRSLVFFFDLLLTMIIVLYDRFLSERATRTKANAINPTFVNSCGHSHQRVHEKRRLVTRRGSSRC